MPPQIKSSICKYRIRNIHDVDFAHIHTHFWYSFAIWYTFIHIESHTPIWKIMWLNWSPAQTHQTYTMKWISAIEGFRDIMYFYQLDIPFNHGRCYTNSLFFWDVGDVFFFWNSIIRAFVTKTLFDLNLLTSINGYDFKISSSLHFLIGYFWA